MTNLSKFPIFNKILTRQQGLGREPLEHHVQFHRMIKLLNNYLMRDIGALEKIFELEIKSNKSFLENTQNLINFIALKLFGGIAYWQTVSDYHKLAEELQSGGSLSEGLLRKYYFSAVSHKFKADIRTGKTNLEKLAPKLVKLTDSIFLKIIRLNADILRTFGGDEMRFLRALLFFLIVMIISGIVIRLLKQKMDIKYEDYVKIVTGIYYGHSLSLEQFRLLEKDNLLGGIVFRGLFLEDPRAILAALSGRSPGTSWTIDRNRAVSYATYHRKYPTLQKTLDREFGYNIGSLQEFDSLFSKEVTAFLNSGKERTAIYFFIDDAAVAVEVAKRLIYLQQLKKNYEFRTIETSMIFSYPIITEKTLLYLGGKHIGEFLLYHKQKEVIIKPKFFKISKFSVDIALRIDLTK